MKNLFINNVKITYLDRPDSDSKNRLLAVAVPELTVDFCLPFDSFAPSAVETVFKISTSLGSLAIYIPKYSPVHQVQKASYLAQESFQGSGYLFRQIQKIRFYMGRKGIKINQK